MFHLGGLTNLHFFIFSFFYGISTVFFDGTKDYGGYNGLYLSRDRREDERLLPADLFLSISGTIILRVT